jgi:type II secretory pathway component GspD/PulD (secretin)
MKNVTASLVIFVGLTYPLYGAAPNPPSTTPAPASAQGGPVSQGIDPDQIPDNDNLITQIFTLSYLTGPDAKATLTSLVSPQATLAATSSALIITDTSRNVKRVAQILKMLDAAPPSKNIIVVVPVNPGSAAEAARQVNAVMGQSHN